MIVHKRGVLNEFLQSLLHAHRNRILLSVIITVFSGLTKGGSFIMLIPLLGLAGITAGANANSASVEIANWVWNVLGIPITLYSCLASYLLLILIYALLGYVKTRLDTQIINEYKLNLRNKLFSAVIEAEWGYIKNTPGSHIFNNLITEINNIGYATQVLVSAFSTVVLLFFYTATSLYISVKMTLIATVCFLPLLIIQRQLNQKVYAIGEAAYEQHEGLFKAVLEFINSFKLAKSYNFQNQYVADFQKITRQTAQDEYRFANISAGTDILYEVGSAVIISVILAWAIAVVKIPVVDLLLMIYIASRLLPNVSSLIRNFQYLLNTLPSYEGVATLMTQARTHKEAKNNCLPLIEFPKRAMKFSDVDFSYEQNEPVFSKLNCEIKVGRTTSIVGASGKGKTTLVDLLLGLLKPQKGTIWIDDTDLSQLDLVAWREATAYIPQECFLFHTTIRQNLLRAKPDASDQELHQVLKSVAGEFVFDLAHGLDTVVGDQGIRLSGGERQRIALARALLRAPQLLILDEATNALDKTNEGVIRQAIRELHGKTTILIISHDQYLNEEADEIILIN